MSEDCCCSLVTEAGDGVSMPNILDVLPKDVLPIGVHESYPVSGRKSRSRPSSTRTSIGTAVLSRITYGTTVPVDLYA